MRPRVPTRERFEAKYVVEANGCWLWSAYVTRLGYGRFVLSDVPIAAHRASWTLNVGPIPAGLDVLHRCDVRRCVNPAHLFRCTDLDKGRDMMAKGRGNKPHGETHGRAKVTAEQVRQIRHRFATGERQFELRAEFGLSKAQVSKICRGQSWA
ncbi:MAG: HNH endonuclease [Archangiaceae bacterium]|nr:HNH endonuclease [Archangiaceae bacterium]